MLGLRGQKELQFGSCSHRYCWVLSHADQEIEHIFEDRTQIGLQAAGVYPLRTLPVPRLDKIIDPR